MEFKKAGRQASERAHLVGFIGELLQQVLVLHAERDAAIRHAAQLESQLEIVRETRDDLEVTCEILRARAEAASPKSAVAP